MSRIEIQLLNLPRFHQHAVEKLTAWFDGGEPLTMELAAESEPSEAPTSYSIDGQRISMQFDGLCPVPLAPTELAAKLEAIRARLMGLQSVAWLTCIRRPPPRRTFLRGRPKRLDPDGGNATQLLAYDSMAQDFEERFVLPAAAVQLMTRDPNGFVAARHQALDAMEQKHASGLASRFAFQDDAFR